MKVETTAYETHVKSMFLRTFRVCDVVDGDNSKEMDLERAQQNERMFTKTEMRLHWQAASPTVGSAAVMPDITRPTTGTRRNESSSHRWKLRCTQLHAA